MSYPVRDLDLNWCALQAGHHDFFETPALNSPPEKPFRLLDFQENEL
jgi:hypothetical protein